MRPVFVIGPALPTCGVPSKSGAMHCELPPDHMAGTAKWEIHHGRDRLGRWRSWGMK